MREHIKKLLPEPVLSQLRHVRDDVRYLFGRPWIGGEGIVIPVDERTVRKIYNETCFQRDRLFGRTPEGEALTAHQSEYFVRVMSYDGAGMVMERLGRPVGNYHGLGRVEDADALVSFLDGIGPELARHGLMHHDFHPGNVLYDPRNKSYKLGDFCWAHRSGRRCTRPSSGGDCATSSDARSIDMLRREVDAHLARPRLSLDRVLRLAH